MSRKLELDFSSSHTLVFSVGGHVAAAETASLAFPASEAAPGSNGLDGGRLSLVQVSSAKLS